MLGKSINEVPGKVGRSDYVDPHAPPEMIAEDKTKFDSMEYKKLNPEMDGEKLNISADSIDSFLTLYRKFLIENFIEEKEQELDEWAYLLEFKENKDGNDINCHSEYVNQFVAEGDIYALYQVIESFYNMSGYPYKSLMRKNKSALTESFIINNKGDQFVFHPEAYIDLQNKENGNRLILEMEFRHSTRFNIHFHHDEESEMLFFLEKYKHYLQNFSIYKNATLSFKINDLDSKLKLEFLANPKVSGKDVILPEAIKKEIEKNVISIFSRKEFFTQNNIKLKRGVLLAGPPGNGKTTLIKYITTLLYGTVTVIHISHEISFNFLYSLAKRYAPALIIIEDIDKISASNANSSSDVKSDNVGTLLTILDGLEELSGIVTLATTNNVDILDEAIKNRPNRFDRKIHVTAPDTQERIQMLEKFFTKYKIHVLNLNLTEIAALTKGFSGAMLEELAITTKMTLLDEDKTEITYHDVTKALDILNRNFHDGIQEAKKNIGHANGHATIGLRNTLYHEQETAVSG